MSILFCSLLHLSWHKTSAQTEDFQCILAILSAKQHSKWFFNRELVLSVQPYHSIRMIDFAAYLQSDRLFPGSDRVRHQNLPQRSLSALREAIEQSLFGYGGEADRTGQCYRNILACRTYINANDLSRVSALHSYLRRTDMRVVKRFKEVCPCHYSPCLLVGDFRHVQIFRRRHRRKRCHGKPWQQWRKKWSCFR